MDMLNRRRSIKEWNSTYFALIPKIARPCQVSDYCPINLCNVAYKIVSKVLANRLKNVLDKIISENQVAFIPRRLISDNIVIDHERIHATRRNDQVRVA